MKIYFLVFLCYFISFSFSQDALPPLNINIYDTSVSGLSSGGYFAVQMHVAYSSIMTGAGVFAGGPYDCANGDLGTALGSCMKGFPSPNIQKCVSTTNSRATNGDIDDPSNLLSQKIYMFSGTQDTTVSPSVMDALLTYYENYVNSSNILYKNNLDAAHTQPTIDKDMNSCTRSYSPYISYCNYDGAGIALEQIYGNLNPRNNGTLSGQMISFDQSIYLSNPSSKSIANTGYIYIPNSCNSNEQCRLHVALHGCLQNYGSVGDDYINHAGYNEWADTNNIVILYPQTIVSNFSPNNPNACWNWWGYNNNPSSYDTKSGYQMNMIYKMIQQITSGYVTITSPSGLKATSISNNSVELQWDSVSEASGYNIMRNSMIINSNPITLTQYTDTSVSSGSYYFYQIIALQGQSSSIPSTPIVVKTTGTPPPLTSPTNLQIASITNSSVTLSWDIVSGASNYNIYRDNNKINNNPVVLLTFTDTGLQSSTTYSYSVTAERDSEESSPSNTIQVTTDSSFICTTTTDSNYDHVQAGRAYEKLGITYANGSNQNMGLYNLFVQTTLSQTSPNFYIIGDCPN